MITLRSPAKVNLFLRVLGKREDGYHSIASLMQTIDLCDTLTFRLSHEDRLLCSYPHFPLDESNLIRKAARLFEKKTGIRSALHVEVVKRIPMEAGVGGGSSNAATTLWALNELHRRPAAPQDLQQWSAELGSDIPFFFSLGTAYCTGRGEVVQEIAPLKPLSLWVVKPDKGLSSGEVYKNLTLPLSASAPEFLLASFRSVDPQFSNDLETSAFHIMPTLKALKGFLIDRGFTHVMLAGSGSSMICFGSIPPPLLPGVVSYHAKYFNRSASGWY